MAFSLWRGFAPRAAAGAMAVAMLAVGAQAQFGLTVYASVNGTQFSSGSTNAQSYQVVPTASAPFPMPSVTVWVSDCGPDAHTVDWTVYLSYDGYGTPNFKAQQAPQDPYTVPWGNTDFGGTVSVQATVYNCRGGRIGNVDFNFSIIADDGRDPTEAEVDSITGCPSVCQPWFLGSMIAHESGGHQFDSGGTPVVGADSNGTSDVGIVQVNASHSGYFENPNASPYWDCIGNIHDAQDILNGDEGLGTTCVPGQQGCGAYAFWDSQVNQMCSAIPGASYSGGAQTGDGSCSQIKEPANPSWPYCVFNLAANTASPYKDGELIQQYNGAPDGNFIYWDNAANDWAFNFGPNNYVQAVCTSAPF